MSSTDLLTRGELIKLARLLGVGPAAVQFLAPLGHGALRQLGDRMSAALFDEHRQAFQRLADASRLLPASLVAKLSELVFGPMLSARVAGVMAPERAVEVARRLRTRFLADVCVELDPRRTAELLAQIPREIVVAVAALLLERGEYLTMGRLVDELSDAAVRAVIGQVEDDAALVRIASFVERRERLIELVDIIPPARLRRMVATVAEGGDEVQIAGLAMMSQLSERQQGRIGDAAVALGAETLKALMAAAGRAGAIDVLRRVLRHMSGESRIELLKILPGFL